MLVWGLTLVLLLSPASLGLAFAFPSRGNPFLNEPDTPNGFFQFLAVGTALVGVIMILVGAFRLATIIDDAGRAVLDDLRARRGGA